jgi:hypothetical protein
VNVQIGADSVTVEVCGEAVLAGELFHPIKVRRCRLTLSNSRRKR